MKDEALNILSTMIEETPQLEQCIPQITRVFEILKSCFAAGGKLMICGNGGSAADGEHIVGELMKNFRMERKISAGILPKISAFDPKAGKYLLSHLQGTLPAIALSSNSSLASAYINDAAADILFAQQVYGYYKENDVILGISTSGRSRNVYYAMLTGKALGAKCIVMSGSSPGEISSLCDAGIYVPARDTFRTQEFHVIVYHALCAMLECEFF